MVSVYSLNGSLLFNLVQVIIIDEILKFFSRNSGKFLFFLFLFGVGASFFASVLPKIM